MRILFLSRWFPYPANNGSKLRVYHLLRGLAQQHDVTLISFADELNRTPDPRALQELCAEVYVVPWHDTSPVGWTAQAAWLSPQPRSLVHTFSAQMAETIARTLHTGRFDLVVASQLATAAYADSFGTTPALFEEAESAVYWEQFAHAAGVPGRLRHGLTWHKYRRYLARLLHRFGAVTVASSAEGALLKRIAPAGPAVAVVPNCLDMACYDRPAITVEPNRLIFTGPFRYHANHQAMVWFLEHVYPRIQAAVPDVALTITGDHADRPLPPATNVTLTGQVPDIRPLVARATCSVVPLQVGGGTRLKILESMALGTPVISTHKGAQGLDVRHGEHLLLADEPAAFADAVVRALGDAALRRRLVEAGRALVYARYDWDAVLPQFMNLADDVAMQRVIAPRA